MLLTEEAKKQRDAYMREYRKKNKDKIREYQRNYYKSNKEKYKEYNENYWNRKAHTAKQDG